MSQKDIRIFDDTVLKLTVKQGTEKERMNISDIGTDGETIYASGTNIKVLEYNDISAIPGSFNSGELAYTRDTNRLFVGNISLTLSPNQQQTFGGTLTGNKYLGYIDSKPAISNTTNNGVPMTLGGDNGLLTSASNFRSYEFNDSTTGQAYKTKDKKWSRLSFYNSKYDAYDGDFMYDIYRNALILFDHNITPKTNPEPDSPKVGGRRKTPLQARKPSDPDAVIDNALTTVKQHTEDMYGDGYVLLYNVIPDGTTLTFADRKFDTTTGECTSGNDSLKNNFSYNVIKVNKVEAASIIDALDSKYFKSDGGHVTLDSANIAKLSNININKNINVDKSIIYYNGKELTNSDVSISALSSIIGGWDTEKYKTLSDFIASSIDYDLVADAIKKTVSVTKDEFNRLDSRVYALENPTSDATVNGKIANLTTKVENLESENIDLKNRLNEVENTLSKTQYYLMLLWDETSKSPMIDWDAEIVEDQLTEDE